MSQFDPFQFFTRFQQQENTGSTIPMVLRVTLEDLYIGKKVEIMMTRTTICPHCRGNGAEDMSDIKPCPYCNGQGFTLKNIKIFPGMYQRIQEMLE